MKQEIAKLIEKALADQKRDVDNSFPSIFSREDVKHQLEEFGYGLLTIVMEMKDASSNSITSDKVTELRDELLSVVNRKIDRLDSNELVDYDSACFVINYDNRVELESIDSDSTNIIDAVEQGIDEVLESFFTTPETTEVTVELVSEA